MYVKAMAVLHGRWQRLEQAVGGGDDLGQLGVGQGLPHVVLPDELLRGADEDLDVAPEGGRDGLEGDLVEQGGRGAGDGADGGVGGGRLSDGEGRQFLELRDESREPGQLVVEDGLVGGGREGRDGRGRAWQLGERRG